MNINYNIIINYVFNRYCNKLKAGIITLEWLENNCDYYLSLFTGKQLDRLKRLQKKNYYKALTKRKAKG